MLPIGPSIVLNGKPCFSTAQKHLAHTGNSEQRAVHGWPSYLSQEAERLDHGPHAFSVQPNPGESKGESAFRRDQFGEICDPSIADVLKPEDLDRFTWTVGMKQTQCLATEGPYLLLKVSAVLSA